MTKKLKKLFACLLALMLIGSSGVLAPLQVSGATDEELKEPKELSKTTDSIILELQKDVEYAIGVVEENKKAETDETKNDTTENTENGKLIWKWAEKEQYDFEKNTVTFKELKADTEYQFACRPKDSQDETNLKISTIRTAVTDDAAPPQTTPTTPPSTDNSTETTEPPQTTTTTPPVTNDTSETNDPPQTTETTPPITNNTSETNDPPQTTETTPPVTNNTSETNNPPQTTTTTPPAPTDTSETNDPPQTTATTPVKPEAPKAPELDSCTDTKVVLKKVDTQEYAVLKENQPSEWVDDPIFNELTANTEYQFVTRIKSTSDAEASEPSTVLAVKTKAAAAKAPAIPELQSRTDISITVKTVPSQEYALKSDVNIGTWNTTGLFEGLTPETKYSIVTRNAYDDAAQMPSEISLPLSVTTKKSAAKAPDAPKLTERGEDYITLQSGENLEYAISTDGNKLNWQADTKFSGLKPGTAYQFAARVKFNPDKEMDSKISPAAVYKTYLSFDGSIKGITPNGTYYKRTELTATAIGTGMNNTSPASGDSRWIPKTWNWDEKNDRTWSKAPYSVTFTLDKTGAYKLTVGFELEEYTADGWKSVGTSKSVSVSFKAVNPIYTITASTGKHGTISPNGNNKVEDGNNLTFTFKPDKDYQVEKVLVDGVSVKFKDNKYTFTDVTKNHEISVTFEIIDDETAPQTGDDSPIAIILALMAISFILLIGLVTGLKKKAK